MAGSEQVGQRPEMAEGTAVEAGLVCVGVFPPEHSRTPTEGGGHLEAAI